MSVESEAFLEHAGVKGMKWGKRKTGVIGTKYGRQQRQEAGAARVANNTKSHLNKRTAGKAVAAIVLLRVGSNIAGKVSGKASVAKGMRTAANITSVAVAAKATSDIRNNRLAQKARR